MLMNGVFWIIFAFLTIATTKYLTSIRLRNLQAKRHKDQLETNELKRAFNQAAEEESDLKSRAENLQNTISALNNTIVNIEKNIGKNRTISSQEE